MPAHLSEEEQIDALKRWWQDNGKITVSAVLLAAVGYFAWTLWQSHAEDVAAEASAEYDKLVKITKVEEGKTLTAEQKSQARAIADTIADKYKSSLYADLASLALAKLAVEDNDLATASTALRRVAETSADKPTVELARLRLAKVLAADGKVDDALGLLNTSVSTAFEASYAEAKGDILLAANRMSEAFNAYQAALTAAEKPDAQTAPMRRSLLQFKLDSAREPGAVRNPLSVDENAAPNPHAGPNPSIKLDAAPAAGAN